MDAEVKIADIVRAVRKVVGPGPVPMLHKPFIDGNPFAGGFKDGPTGNYYIHEFEEMLAHVCGVSHAVAVSSGTAALHLALLVAGMDKDCMVGIGNMTFAGAAAAIAYTGATPVLGGGIPMEAFISTDLLGHAAIPADVPKSLMVIEDAAQALGTTLYGKPCGSFGRIGIMSFNNNKIVTTNGGGAVLTDFWGAAEFVRHMATTAKVPSPFYYEHDAVGFNYRMGNINAALGMHQLAGLEQILTRKRETFGRYRAAFDAIGMDTEAPRAGELHNCWLKTIDVGSAGARDALLVALQHEGIAARAMFTPLYRQKPYQGLHVDAENAAAADAIFDRLVCLPSGMLQ